MAPRLMMNLADVDKTGAVQPGSRVTWRYKFGGNENQLDGYEKWLLPQLKPEQRWYGLEQDEGALGRSMERSQQFLLLSALLTLLLAVAAVAVAMNHYCRSCYDLVAILKTLGAGRAQLRKLIVGQWLMVLTLSAVTGGAIGLLFENVLMVLLKPVLPAALPPASLWPWLWALGTMTVISLLVGLRPYRLLLATQPLRVLRNDVVANVWPLKFYLPIVSVVVVLLLAGLMGGSMLLWAVLAGAVVLALLCGVLGWMLLNVLRRMTLKSLPLRLAVSRLLRQPWSTLSQLSAFSLSFMLLALLLVLRASGYTKGELVRHYLSMPVIVTLISALVGNVLGYTVFKDVVVSMYYNSYSLPTYETIWNPDAFFKTTLIPVVLMFMVNLIVIIKMMQHTPLQFLRHDLKKTKRKKAMRLPHFKFFNRFRLRIMFQNVANYLILFVGIFFIMVMLAMAVGMPDTLSYYKENAKNMMFAKYQYVLKSFEDEDGNVLTTDNKDAEKFSMCSLQKKSDVIDEEVSVYGISDDSKYVEIKGMQSLQEDEVYISRSFSEKYELNVGDTVSLDEKYENKQYTFTIAGIYDQCVNIAVFMPIENYRMVFELDEEAFSGYFSNEELADLSEDDIATVITERDITKMCDQLDHSMGSYMDYFQILCILLSAVLIYLLTKLIIEKNENAISMTKILGYENKEIASLYLLSTTIMVVIEDAVSVVLGAFVMNLAWKAILFSYSGWFAFVIQPAGYVKMFAFVLIGYLFVMILDFMRIKKIPMDQALKNVE